MSLQLYRVRPVEQGLSYKTPKVPLISTSENSQLYQLPSKHSIPVRSFWQGLLNAATTILSHASAAGYVVHKG